MAGWEAGRPILQMAPGRLRGWEAGRQTATVLEIALCEGEFIETLWRFVEIYGDLFWGICGYL